MPDLSAIDWRGLLDMATVSSAVRIVLLLAVGYPLLLLLSALVKRITRRRFSDQSAMLVRKAVFYAGMVFLFVSVLDELDFPLTTLLGAAGIVGIALGFASQTSVSNIISGLFLISEKPFEVGDLIKVGDTLGTVLSIDLLSVKVRAFDNQYIRIPNENLIKTEVKNLTKFPIRRVDLSVGVAYKEDVRRVQAVLEDVAAQNPYCLDEPEPMILFTNFGESALEFFVGVWCIKSDFFTLKHTIMQEIKERFDAEGIEIPFPHRTLYTGAETAPLPVRVVNEPPGPDAAPDSGDAAAE